MNKQIEDMVLDSVNLLTREVLQVEPLTFVRLSYDPVGRGKRLFGIGFSRLMLGDVWNELLGFEIARGKAVKQIVRQIEAQGNHRISVSLEVREEKND